MTKNDEFTAVTTATMRRWRMLEDLPKALESAVAAKGDFPADHPRQREIDAEILRLETLIYMADNTADYGLRMTVKDAGIIVKYLAKKEGQP